MATLAVPIHHAEEAFNPNAVKVVMGAEGYALYFSRATIPWDRDRFAQSKETIGETFLRHIGIYGYRAGFIRRYVATGHQARWSILKCSNNFACCGTARKFTLRLPEEIPGTGVDTPEDLERVRVEMR